MVAISFDKNLTLLNYLNTFILPCTSTLLRGRTGALNIFLLVLAPKNYLNLTFKFNSYMITQIMIFTHFGHTVTIFGKSRL